MQKNNTILIFDDLHWFRVSLGGAKNCTKLNLTTLGKGMANGMPLSALVVRKEL